MCTVYIVKLVHAPHYELYSYVIIAEKILGKAN